MNRGRLTAAALGAAAIGMTVMANGEQHPNTEAARPLAHEVPHAAALLSPPTTAECLQIFGFRCYRPAQLERAYDLTSLHRAGIDGSGRTILIVDSFGSPTIANDLRVFDRTFGIPDPPDLEIRQDAGRVPAFDPNNGDMAGWADETTLDVEWSHVFAPGARIVLEETPVSETEGVQGFPEIVKAENYAIDHGMADVISQSFGATEQTFPTADSLLDLRSSFSNARRHRVTVIASSGDTGAAGLLPDSQCCYQQRAIEWPSSDPLVTSIGGTRLHLDRAGDRTQPDTVWQDGGGGLSVVFKRPSFQHTVADVVGKRRGIPDVSMSAATDGAVVTYHTFLPSDDATQDGPWHIISGTSEGAPEFAGIVAMADQLAGRRLGHINKALYSLDYGRDGLVDVTVGNNTFSFLDMHDNTVTVPGFAAAAGYDLASGLGTVDAARLVRALAASGGDQGDTSAP